MMNFIIENWYMIVAIIALLIFLGIAIFIFFRLPTSKQLEAIREWLLFAVTEAEKELGGGTGQIKLRYVYDLFIARFKWLSLIVTFDMFSTLVDEALEEMRHLLETNQAVKMLVKGEEQS